jgi:hypothetical protein
LFPEPEILDKETWEKEALPFMSKWLGLSKINLQIRPGGKHVEAAGIFPNAPLIAAEDWEAIRRYYLETAPARALPQPPRPRIQRELNGFDLLNPDYRFEVPLTTLVKIDPGKRQFYLGDAGTRTLNLLDARGRLQVSLPLDSAPVSLVFKDSWIYATLIGTLTPSDEPQGKLLVLKRTPGGFQQVAELASALPRPTDTVFADLNGDGLEDFAVCGFGNYLGRFSWFENRGDGKYEEHILIDRPGAVKAYGREGIFLFINQGKGEFSLKPLVEQHPAFGNSYFELLDFNADGSIDILATNGDNGEYPSCLKPYHGVRLYLNDGRNNFGEAWFFPLNGAYKAVAEDFDKDGKLDIAAISYFPDYVRSPEESFVFLENKGGLKFTASSFPKASTGRWLTMDVQDLDGDGWSDIVLGSLIRGPTSAPARYANYWNREGPSFVILRNKRGETE